MYLSWTVSTLLGHASSCPYFDGHSALNDATVVHEMLCRFLSHNVYFNLAFYSTFSVCINKDMN